MRAKRSLVGRVLWAVFVGLLFAASHSGEADTDTASQAKQSQNPIADARPTEGPHWQVRTQVQFLFPK